jgi:D-3-phosphoglycerate dehydrogenase
MRLLCPNKSLFSKEIIHKFNKNFKCKFLDLSQFQFNKICHNYDIILLRFTLNIKFKIKSKIKYIISPTTGLNHIDKKIIESKRVQIISLQKENHFLNKINSTVEHTFFLLFNILRLYPKKIKFGYKKNYANWISRELFNKNFGIIGMGRIGKKVFKILKAFGCYINFYDIKNIKGKKNLKYILTKSDIISFHVPLNNKTNNFFNYNILKNIKKNSILINTSRGEIFDQKDLLKILKLRKVSFAADVLSHENNAYKVKDFINKLKSYRIKYFLTPHVAGLSKESVFKTDNFIYKKFLKYYNGQIYS